MCTQCTTEAKHLFPDPEGPNADEALPGWYFAQAQKDDPPIEAGDYMLGIINDPVLAWNFAPMPDDDTDEWIEAAQEFQEGLITSRMLPEHHYLLVKSAVSLGYNPEKDGFFAFWLFDYLSRFVCD